MTLSIILFAIPKAFDQGHTGIIQNNAIESWRRLADTTVVLFGRDAGVAEAAASIGAVHIPDIATNDLGTPMISDAFAQVRSRWPEAVHLYVNSDIILTSSLLDACAATQARFGSNWMMVGRRVDCDVTTAIDFSQGWPDRVQTIAAQGSLHGPSGMDYFACGADMPVVLPEMAVGRPGWDSWFVFEALRRRVPVVDATSAVLAVHQNHPSAYSSTGTEARRNLEAAGGLFNVATIRQTSYKLDQAGTIAPDHLGRLLFSYPARWCMGTLRNLRSRRSN